MSGWQSPKRLLLVCILLGIALTSPHPARAWGDEGHKVIALIAEHYLDPAARAKVATLLTADTDSLTATTSRARRHGRTNIETTKIRYEATWGWHFVDIELARPDLASACFSQRPPPPRSLHPRLNCH
jgi:hypothetical protein